MNKIYASKLTKEELIENGITDITTDGKVFRNGQEIHLSKNKSGYLVFSIYEKDEYGNKIKIPCNRDFNYTNKDGTEKVCNVDTYVYRYATIGVHRAMWAWYFNEVPQGLVVDHIDNNKQNNTLENLQLLTQGANVMKEREFSTKEIKCRLNVPRSFYENKLFKAIEACKEAQLNHDTEAYNKARGLKYMACARLRYYDSHLEEAERILTEQEQDRVAKALASEAYHKRAREKNLLKRWKKLFKELKYTAMWREIILVEKVWDTLSANKKEEIFQKLKNRFPIYYEQVHGEELKLMTDKKGE